MNANELADEIGSILYPYCEEAATMLRQQQAEIDKVNAEWVQAAMALGKCVQENHSLKADSKRLDWIWKQAQRGNGGVFTLEGVHLFTVITQHMRNTAGIRQMIDDAMGIEASGKNDYLISGKM